MSDGKYEASLPDDAVLERLNDEVVSASAGEGLRRLVLAGDELIAALMHDAGYCCGHNGRGLCGCDLPICRLLFKWNRLSDKVLE